MRVLKVEVVRVVKAIDRREVRRLQDAGAQVVDVLAAAEFEAEHLPGARNLPLRELAGRAVHELDRDQPVIVYCHDSL